MAQVSRGMVEGWGSAGLRAGAGSFSSAERTLTLALPGRPGVALDEAVCSVGHEGLSSDLSAAGCWENPLSTSQTEFFTGTRGPPGSGRRA